MPRIRVHDVLGVLLRWPADDGWLWICHGREQSQRMTERWAHGPGWRELDTATDIHGPDRASLQLLREIVELEDRFGDGLFGDLMERARALVEEVDRG